MKVTILKDLPQFELKAGDEVDHPLAKRWVEYGLAAYVSESEDRKAAPEGPAKGRRRRSG